jgi:GTP-binding protein Era
MASENFRSGFVTIVGRPNVGKSTLMNAIIGQKIAITSKKPQTTRNRIQTVYTEEDRGQIIFVDTPGIHKAKNKLGEYMVDTATSAMRDVDLVLWLVEPSEKIGGGDRHIAETLQKLDCPVILIINKSDTIAVKEDMLKFIDAYRGIMDFAEIIPASAMKGNGVSDILDSIFKYLPEGPMYYDEDTVTDQPMRAIAAEIIREKALHALDDEIPHGIAVTVEKMRERKDKPITDIEATIIVERDSHKGIVIGKGGAMLKKIGTNARFEIEKLIEGKCNLKLWVKVRKDWRDSDGQLKNFGYVKQEEDM